jgi:hypothetical protein
MIRHLDHNGNRAQMAARMPKKRAAVLPAFVTWLLFLLGQAVDAQSVHPLPRRKLIEFGWNSPTPAVLRDRIAEIEETPFEGVTVRLPDDAGGGFIFDVKKLAAVKDEDREREARILESLPRSTKLADNFLVLHGTSTMAWFDDDDWAKSEGYLRWCARVAKTGGCRGVIWDAEPYNGINLWHYPSIAASDKRSFAEFYRQVRKRGAQFIRALQEEFPGITIISLRQISDFQEGSPFSVGLLPVHDLVAAEKQLAESHWGLHAAFTNGILDGIASGVRFVDGNEEGYFYTSPLHYYRAYHTLRHEALALVAPENHAKYAAQFTVGHAVSLDYPAGNWAEKISSFPDYLRKQALELTPEQRAQWFEHNVYHALRTADEYVWIYTEDLNWWDNRNIPAGFAEALASARRKHDQGIPLGFAMETTLLEAQKRIKAKSQP